MTICTKSLRDPVEPADGTRLLISRYRPWGIRRGEATWDDWEKALAPSVRLLDEAFGKRRNGGKVVATGLPSIPWDEFVGQFLEEMESPTAQAALSNIQERSASGETITPKGQRNPIADSLITISSSVRIGPRTPCALDSRPSCSQYQCSCAALVRERRDVGGRTRWGV